MVGPHYTDTVFHNHRVVRLNHHIIPLPGAIIPSLPDTKTTSGWHLWWLLQPQLTFLRTAIWPAIPYPCNLRLTHRQGILPCSSLHWQKVPPQRHKYYHWRCWRCKKCLVLKMLNSNLGGNLESSTSGCSICILKYKPDLQEKNDTLLPQGTIIINNKT